VGASPSDADAIAASLQDGEAFVAIFDRHFSTIHRYLTRRVGPDLAGELVSETFARAFDSRRRYDLSRPDALPWLYGITTKLLAKARRAEKRRLRAIARLDVHAHGGDDAARALDVDVAAALAMLPRAEREALLLFAWGGLTYDEIAAALAIPVGTVRSRLNRARLHARELLDPPAIAPAQAEEALDG
jgi:RNA polymerase sigma-70 factor, ECF subfamily